MPFILQATDRTPARYLLGSAPSVTFSTERPGSAKTFYDAQAALDYLAQHQPAGNWKPVPLERAPAQIIYGKIFPPVNIPF